MKEVKMGKTLLLIDVSSLIYRAHYTFDVGKFKRPSDGKENNVVYGVASMLTTLLKGYKGELYPVACIDSKTCNEKRKEVNAEYKKNRPKCPMTMVHQFEWVDNLIDSLNISKELREGYEADDVIASYCKQCDGEYDKIVIHSPDKDLSQLVGGSVVIFNPRLKKEMGVEDICEKYGVTPKDFVMYQSLVGDKVDGIEGVPGIGPKSAVDIINVCGGDLELYMRENVGHSKYKKVENNLERIKMNEKLVTLCKELEVNKGVRKWDQRKVKQEGRYKKFMEVMEITSKQLLKYA